MPHRSHRVVRLVAVERPVARRIRDELERAHLAHRHVHCHFGPSSLFRNPAAIGAGDREVDAVQMNRVIGHGEVAHANAHPVSQAHHQRIDARKRAAVPGPQVEIEHGRDLRRVAAGIDVVGIDEEHEVAVHAMQRRIFRVHHDEAHHAHGHLHHLVGVRVIHEGAGLLHLEFVDESLAGLNLRLGQTAHAVHAVGQQDAVPVDGGVLGQLVGDEDAQLVAFHAFDGRPGRLAVVAPQPRDHAGRDLALDRLGDEVELLPAVARAPRQRPAVERDDRVVGAAIHGAQRWLGCGALLDRRFGERGRARASDGGGTENGAGGLEKTASCVVHERYSLGAAWAAVAGLSAPAPVRVGVGGRRPPRAARNSVSASQ